MKAYTPSPLTVHILVALAADPLTRYGITEQIIIDIESSDYVNERSVYKAVVRIEAAGFIERAEETNSRIIRYKLTN